MKMNELFSPARLASQALSHGHLGRGVVLDISQSKNFQAQVFQESLYSIISLPAHHKFPCDGISVLL